MCALEETTIVNLHERDPIVLYVLAFLLCGMDDHFVRRFLHPISSDLPPCGLPVIQVHSFGNNNYALTLGAKF
jgi:hypothetical protein